MGKSHIKANKHECDGYTFDSMDEMEYYLHLKEQVDIEHIRPHPKYTLMTSFHIKCGRCNEGKTKSPRTGRMINCKRCSGTGEIKRKPWTYSPDFKVWYKDGRVEVIDVKGGWKNERFNLVRKMFEWTEEHELIVVKKDKEKGWVRS